MRRILCLHLPYLPTERARRDGGWAGEPQRPLVLTRPAGSSLVVEQVCPRARQLGLRPGLSLGQAQAIAPELVALSHQPQRDRATLERLARWAVRFSPVVEPVEPDTLLIDITGCERLFGGEANIARQAAEGLAHQGFRVRAAIADTVGAACALAVAGVEPLTVAPVGQTGAWLAPLPPAALRIEPQASERLEALGVRSIGDLLMLPRASLPARFGSQLVLRLQQALGEVFEPLTPHKPEEVPFARRDFETPVVGGEAILSAAEHLLADVFEQVLRRERALRRLECVIHYERTPPRVISIGLARASRARQHVAELLRQRLEQIDLATDVSRAPSAVANAGMEEMAGEARPAQITGLMLVARETSRFHGGQGELFEPREPGDDEALGCLIDRLAGRLGYEAVLRPRLVDDHQPEKAFRYLSVAEAGCEPDTAPPTAVAPTARPGVAHLFRGGGHEFEGRSVSPTAKTIDHPMGEHAEVQVSGAMPVRPVRLLSRPILIRVIALVPDGPPTWFSYRGREYVVAQTQGPERLETAWWRGPDVRRDYFRVTVESGEQFWIFHAADERRWYLHGVFS